MPISYKIKEYQYQFITKAGSKYLIQLEDVTELSGIPDPQPCKAICISILKDVDRIDGKDPKISNTIALSILEHLQRFQHHVMYYICSTEGGHANARKKLFLNWFNSHKNGQSVLESYLIEDEEHFFIYHTTNNSAKHFITSFIHKLKK